MNNLNTTCKPLTFFKNWPVSVKFFRFFLLFLALLSPRFDLLKSNGVLVVYRSGTVNSNTVNSKFHLI